MSAASPISWKWTKRMNPIATSERQEPSSLAPAHGWAERQPWTQAEDDDIRWWYGSANGAMASYKYMANQLNQRYHAGKSVRTISAVRRRETKILKGQI